MAKKKISRKKLFILLGIFIALLAYVLIFETGEKEEKKNPLFEFVIAEVNKFEITREKEIIEVGRKGNTWEIIKPVNLPASREDVDAFLSDVKDLEYERVIGKNLPDLKPYGLDKPKITFKIWTGSGKNQKLYTLLIGNQNPAKTGFYVKFKNRPELLLAENYTESVFSKELYYFRDKDIFKITATDIKEFEIVTRTNVYKCIKKEENWFLEKPVTNSSVKEGDVMQILTSIVDLKVRKFFDIKNKVNIIETGLLSPAIKIKLREKDTNKLYQLNIGREIKEDYTYYAKLEGDKKIISVDKYTVEDILKNLEKLKKKPEKKKSKEKKSEKKK